MTPNGAAKFTSTAKQPVGLACMAVFAGISVCLALQFFVPSVTDWLRWQSTDLFTQPWRLVSGHFVHLSTAHGLLNLAALALVWRLFVMDWKRCDGMLLLASIPLTGLLLGFSNLGWYVGFSGVLHGWFLLGALRVFTQQRTLSVVMLASLVLKLWLEPGNPLGAGEEAFIGGPVAYVAHQLGTLAMVLLVVFQFAATALWDRVRR